MRKLLTLWETLRYGDDELKDERTASQLQSVRIGVLSVACLFLFVVILFYTRIETMNRAQLALLATAAIFTLVGGLCLGCSAKGIVTLSSPFGGRILFGAGMVIACLHWGMLIPASQYFGQIFFFTDLGIFGMLAFYLLCNGAYRSWIILQEKIDKSETLDEETLARRRYRRGIGIAGLLFFLLILSPSVLQYAVFSEKTMQQATAAREEKAAAASTPEYEQFISLNERWTQESSEPFMRVFQSRLEAPMTAYLNPPVYENGSCLQLKTADVEIKIAYLVKDGAPELIQSYYWLLDEEDPDYAEFIYLSGEWMRKDKCNSLQSVDPEYDIPLYTLDFTDCGGSPGALDMKDNVDIQEEGRNTRYVFSYDEGSLLSSEKERSIGYLVNPDKEILAFTFHSLQQAAKGDWEELNVRGRTLTTDQAEIEQLAAQMLASGPFIPEEALYLW